MPELSLPPPTGNRLDCAACLQGLGLKTPALLNGKPLKSRFNSKSPFHIYIYLSAGICSSVLHQPSGFAVVVVVCDGKFTQQNPSHSIVRLSVGGFFWAVAGKKNSDDSI